MLPLQVEYTNYLHVLEVPTHVNNLEHCFEEHLDKELCLLNPMFNTNRDKFQCKSIHYGKKTNEIVGKTMAFDEESLKNKKYKAIASII